MAHAEHHQAVIDAYNEANWDRFRELAGGITYTEPATGRVLTGEDYVQAVMGWKTAFPDMVGTTEKIWESGDNLAAEVTWAGTHTGPMLTPEGEIPPSGNHMSVTAALIATYDGDKLVSTRHYFDLLTILRAVGAA